MRFSADHKRRTRADIVTSAAAQFREKGPNGPSVAELMQGAGLTHGGFYLHFDSREALVREVFSIVADQTIARWKQFSQDVKADEIFRTIVETYLSPNHRDGAREGCALPAFGTEAGRASLPTRKLFALKLEALVDAMAHAQQLPTVLARKKAAATIATMVGGIILARATSGDDLSDEILNAARDSILGVPEKIRRIPRRTSPRKASKAAS